MTLRLVLAAALSVNGIQHLRDLASKVRVPATEENSGPPLPAARFQGARKQSRSLRFIASEN